MKVHIPPVPLPGHGVCEVCRASSTDYARCYSCNKNLQLLDLGTVFPIPTVLPLGLAVKKSPLALALWNYKRSTSQTERADAQAMLIALIDERLPHVLGHVGYVDTVTFVPSRRSDSNPVGALLEETQWGANTWIADTLVVLDTDLDTHSPDQDRFVATDVEDEHVLLIDDTFTTGATSMSAARALFEAGASDVTIVVVGRHASTDWMSDTYLSQAHERAQHGEFCPECSVVVADGAGDYSVSSPFGIADEREPDWQEEWEPEDDDPWAGASQFESRDSEHTDPSDPWSSGSSPTSNPAGYRPSALPSVPTSSAPVPRPPAHSDNRSPQRESLRPDLQHSAEPPSEPSRLSDAAAFVMTAIVATPFAVVFVLPSVLAQVFSSPDPLGRYAPWGPGGLGGYLAFVVVAAGAVGFNWALKSLHSVLATLLFVVTSAFVAAIFLGPLLSSSPDADAGSSPRDSANSSAPSSPNTTSPPRNAQQFREVANERAQEGGTEKVTLDEARNVIESVCPAVEDGLTSAEARTEIESYAEQQGISDSIAERYLWLTEMVIEFSESLC